MGIISEGTIRHPDTIRNPESFDKSQWCIECPHCHRLIGFDGTFCWDWAIDAIQQASPISKITPMDFDGVVERKFHYLIFESKDVGITIPKGQRWALERLLNAESITIMEIYGKEDPESYIAITRYKNGKDDLKVEGQGREDAIGYVKQWFFWANNHR